MICKFNERNCYISRALNKLTKTLKTEDTVSYLKICIVYNKPKKAVLVRIGDGYFYGRIF